MLGWGRNDIHQAGVDSGGTDLNAEAVPLEALRNMDVSCADGHLYHSAFVTGAVLAATSSSGTAV